MIKALLAESKARFCSGAGSQFCYMSWNGTFGGALHWILDGSGGQTQSWILGTFHQILCVTSNGVGSWTSLRRKWCCNDVVVMRQNGFVTKFPKKLCWTTFLILSYLSHVMMVCCILHIYLAHLILDSGINTLYVLYMHSYVLFIYIFLMTTNQSHLTLELWLELQQPDNCNNGFYQLPAFAGYWPKEDYACSSLTPIPSNASICLDYLFLSSSTGIWLVNLLSLSYYFWISLVWNKL